MAQESPQESSPTNWMDQVEANLDAMEKRWEAQFDQWNKDLDNWSDRTDKRIEEWKLRKYADLHLWRLQVAEIYPGFLVHMNDIRASTQYSQEYGKAHDEFMKTLQREIDLTLKYTKPEEKSGKARWICATVIDELETKSRTTDQRKAEQLLLTSRNILNKGITVSDQFDARKIDKSWANELGGHY